MIENWREQQRIVMRDYYKWKRARKYESQRAMAEYDNRSTGSSCNRVADTLDESLANKKDPIDCNR